MRRFLLPISALILLALSPQAGAASMSRCLLPGSCSKKEVKRAMFPEYFLPVTGCQAGPAPVRRAQSRKMVAITFDDGPWAPTGQLLRSLDRLRVKATFFVVGRQIKGQEETLRQMRASGHAIGNHSWSHPMLTSLTNQRVREEMDWTQGAIRKASGYTPCLMRPPYGAYSEQTLPALGGLQPVLWDVDAADWERPSASLIAQRVLAESRPGSIILLHDGGGDRSQTVAAIPAIVKGLRERGLKPVTVPELLSLKERR